MSDHHPTQSDLTPPCPFCGGTDIDVIIDGDGTDIDVIIDGGVAAICCLDCGARGPSEEIIWGTATPIEDAAHYAIMRAAWAWARRAR
jgi:hypothetical protein